MAIGFVAYFRHKDRIFILEEYIMHIFIGRQTKEDLSLEVFYLAV